MVNYSLEEFKAWLEADESRKEGLDWYTHREYFLYWESHPNYFENHFVKTARGELGGNYKKKKYLPYMNVGKKWVAYMEQRERERERERERANSEGETNMVDAQVAFQQRFASDESRQIEYLSIGAAVLRHLKDKYLDPKEQWKIEGLQGELDLSSLPNLKCFSVHLCPELTKIKFGEKMVFIELDQCKKLTNLEGLEKCANLVHLRPHLCSDSFQSPFTFLDSWKTEIANLKAQLAEYESHETSSQTSTESFANLATKINQKKAELANLRDNTRQPTKHLRKEIELLEKIHSLDQQISQLQAQESTYQSQIQHKEQTISQKQAQITQLRTDLQAETTAKSTAQTKITRLEKQITDLRAEKQALQERMLAERQTALSEWNRTKTDLASQISQLNEQKDTFQKSADYLRETLKGAEKELEEAKQELTLSQAQAQQATQSHQQDLAQKAEELRQRNEAFKVLQERNSDLQAKLTQASEEIAQLSQWISKLESASVEGNAFEQLKRELEQSQSQISHLEEQLAGKSSKSYWWIYALLALGAVYLVLS